MKPRDRIRARARLLVSLVAWRLGADIVERAVSALAVKVDRCVVLRTTIREGRIVWVPQYASGGTPETNSSLAVTTSAFRTVSHTIEELERLCLPAVKVWAAQMHLADMRRRTEDRVERERLRQLRRILGCYKGHGGDIRFDGLSIEEAGLFGDYPFVACVKIRSWERFLAIAKIVAEDAREITTPARNASPSDTPLPLYQEQERLAG